MPISWHDIRHNALTFANDWADESSEGAEAKSFWDEFFAVFGIKRRTVASFEEPVRNLSGNRGYIDLFWRGTLLVEHKSRGRSLDRASPGSSRCRKRRCTTNPSTCPRPTR